MSEPITTNGDSPPPPFSFFAETDQAGAPERNVTAEHPD